MLGLRWRNLTVRNPCLKYCTKPERTAVNFDPHLPKSYSTDYKKSKPNFGLIFDIDGVLLRGKTVLDSTLDCFKLIVDSKGNFRVPTVFLTNAGNELRSSKAAKLSALLGVHVNYDQVIMSHSPLKMLNAFHKKRTLISGQGPIVEIAKHLGFNSLITVDDMRQYYPHLDVVDHKRRSFTVTYLTNTCQLTVESLTNLIYLFRQFKPCVLGRYFPPIEAIILFGEPVRWETNLQLIVDVLMCDGRLDRPRNKYPIQNLPLLACNTDMVWMAEASMPRFGHGVFLHCLEQTYQKLSGMELKYSAVVGKPSEITYLYAEMQLNNHARRIGIHEEIKHLYAIGDNLDTDVYGANIYNQILEDTKKSKREQGPKGKKSCDVGEIIRDAPNEDLRKNAESSYMGFHHGGSFSSSAEKIKSILVKTGVFQGDQSNLKQIVNDDLVYSHKDMIVDASLRMPDFLCENVHDAVKLIFEQENF